MRGEVTMSGYVMRPILGQPSCCLMTSITQVDVRGFTPTPMSNMLALRAPYSWCVARTTLAHQGELV